MKRCRVLVIDDSRTARAALRAALTRDREIDVVGEAADGTEARKLIERLKPQLITMDVFLRAESGLDLTAAIMRTAPTPIVVVTAADAKDASLVFRAMQAGALDVCAKLPSPTHPDYAARCTRLIRTIKTLQNVPVVHRWRAAPPGHLAAPSMPAPITVPQPRAGASARAMLLLGASTGGPPVLAKLLRQLPKPFPAPIVLVQHMVPGFVPAFAKWLAEETGHSVRLVTQPCEPNAGVVYLSGDEQHLVVEPGPVVRTIQEAPRGFHRPSIDVLFESAAASSVAARFIGVLLTGMGSDGARGLLSLRQAGAHTIAQEPKSCAVASMPEQAIALDAAQRVLTPEALPAAITSSLMSSSVEARAAKADT
jgi:two-component system chemotaxis response regulator CheB